MNFMVYGIAMLAYWVVGFAIQAGGVGALGTLGGYDKLAHEVSLTIAGRSEERRVGKECRSRWSPYQEKKKEKDCMREVRWAGQLLERGTYGGLLTEC